MRRTRASRTGPAALATACVMTLAACSAGGSAGPATATSSSPARVSSPAGPAGPAPATASATGGADATGSGTAECASGQLRIAEGRPVGATGHAGTDLSFTNVGRTACFVEGYPGVAAATARGQVVANAARTPSGFMSSPGGTVSRVVLRSGQSAYALIEAVDFPSPSGSACAGKTATALLVTPPDQKAATPVPDPIRICSAFQVHPLISSAAYHSR